ncbi:MAG: 30S ribosomal protein S2 [Phycisphaerae bacterium]
MSESIVQELINAGIHFGHRASRWNPKMAPFIYGKRNSIHIIDIRETLKGLLRAKKFLGQTVSRGGDVLFVGTKRQARQSIREHADRTNMHYVVERWLGGTLTNFRTIRSRLERLDELESLVESPRWQSDFSKKMQSVLSRELRKIQRNLGGIRKMSRLPAAMVIVDSKKEHNAVREAQSLGIPTICLLDTDGDPADANIPIPGNDDSMRSIDLVMRHLADACAEGMKGRPLRSEAEQEMGPVDGGPSRRRQRGDGPRPQQAGKAQADAGDAAASSESADQAANAPSATESVSSNAEATTTGN